MRSAAFSIQKVRNPKLNKQFSKNSMKTLPKNNDNNPLFQLSSYANIIKNSVLPYTVHSNNVVEV